MHFKELGLMEPILRALAEEGYKTPSPIQEKAIAPALAGRDVLGCAQTGTGKTCAFATPILQRLNANKPQGRPIRALILTPTRELALQIQESFSHYGRHLPLRSAVIFGGVGQNPQVEALKRGVDILVATPGRLMDLQGQGFLDLSKLEIFVLDEADRMLDMGFIHDVRKILKFLPDKKQTLFFSATMPPEITELVNSLLKNPVKVAVDPVSSPVEIINQSVYLVDKANKSNLLAKLMEEGGVKSALIFTRTKHGANKVAGDLEKSGITAAAIHGNKSQTARQQALADFKAGSIRALVATDIAARGLDIDDLGYVFNYNLPEVPETYVHRIGRTGRAGRGGTAISFCDFGEKPLLKDIEKLIGKTVPVVENHPWPMENFEAMVKDAKGRLVNADIAESRAAAKERKAERLAAAPKKSPAPPPPAVVPAPPKKSKRGHRHQDLAGTMPAQPAKPETEFRRANPFEGDRIMDATARLLAPKPRMAAPVEKRPALGGGHHEPPKKAPRSTAGRDDQARRPQQHRRDGSRPLEAQPRSGLQKDSTEQPSLMKSYYLKND